MNLQLIASLALALPAQAPSPAPAPVAPRAQSKPLEECMQAFRTLHEADDRERCLALWRASPQRALITLAADLERSAALLETAEGAAEALRLRARALWGARLVEEAIDLPLVTDYVASFTGWDEGERALYRAAQKIHERAAASLTAGDLDMALEAGREAVQRSADLGDWFGAALSQATVGEAYRAQGTFDDALIALSRARILWRELGLVQRELEALVGVAAVCSELERDARGLEAARQALLLRVRLAALEPGFEDDARLAELLRARLAMERRAGREAEAGATQRELAALEKR